MIENYNVNKCKTRFVLMQKKISLCDIVTLKLSVNSKSCTTVTNVPNGRRLQRHKLQERVYREKTWTMKELQQRITEKLVCLDHHVIDNAVKQ